MFSGFRLIPGLDRSPVAAAETPGQITVDPVERTLLLVGMLIDLPKSILISCLLFVVACGPISTEGGTESLSELAETESEIQIARPFRYQFFASDIFSWVNGKREGRIPDEMGSSAYFLDSLLRESFVDLSLAVYGVQNQSWFFRALGLDGTEELPVNIQVVVDQEKGALHDWQPGNFTYADTPLLAQRLGNQRITPDLNQNGQPRASTIMHNKFIVAHGEGVWTGTANISETGVGAEYNANTAVYLPFPQVADFYQAEFSQMFDQHLFSIRKSAGSGPGIFRFEDGSRLAVFFSPQHDPVTNAVLPFIEAARQNLDIGMFVLSEPRVKDRLLAAAARGVKIRIILDALFAARADSWHGELRDAGIAVRVENWGGKMHMKTAVADGKRVLMGSMNWTEAGSRQNDENTIVVDNRLLAADVRGYFGALWRSLDQVQNQSPRAESRDSVNSCFDGTDNDHDGDTDNRDSGC